MIELVLFAGRVLLVIVLYVFLFAVMRTGVGLVRGQRPRLRHLGGRTSRRGTRSLRGLHVDILGRSSSAARRPPTSSSTSPTSPRRTPGSPSRVPALVLEDLGSTNGTLVNGHVIDQPVTLRDDDEVQIGDTIMRVSRG